MDEGVFYESVNFAALRQLPVIFVYENNAYSIHSHWTQRHATEDLRERVRTFGIPAYVIEDGNVFSIRNQTLNCAEGVRGGQSGPVFLECKTYRWREHVGPEEDYNAGYRSHEEARPWMEGDQVKSVAAMMDPAPRKKIEDAVEREIEEAFAFAESSPFPGEEELDADTFAD